MEALAAVSLAGNILQFVDTAKNLISSTRQLSALGASKEHIELRTIAQELQTFTSRLVSSDHQKGKESVKERMQVYKGDDSIRSLCKQCNEVAEELLAVLETLTAKNPDGNYGHFENFYKALLGEWKKGEVDALQKRLDRMGVSIQAHLATYDTKIIYQRLDRLAREDRRLDANRKGDIVRLREQFSVAFNDLDKKLQQNESKKHVMAALLEAASKGSRYSAEQIILEHLRFDAINDRHEAIRIAHQQTLSWLFGKGTQNSPATFDDWLSSDDDIYWISGKPGSGKSTMMKFLCDNPQTVEKLNIWAGSGRLIKAEYFFWISGGNELQKSQEGLLQTLVYQILRQGPDMIPQAYPSTWRLFCPEEGDTINTMGTTDVGATIPLSIQGLLATLQTICKASLSSEAKFCFFIDGLDEYEGKPIDMIELIRVLRTLPNLKLCLSSRSWNEFEQEFGKDGTRKLYMQDFNSDDISAYVHDTFSQDENYQDLEDIDTIGNVLIKEIVERANGVFLWVFLVIRSFQDGLINGDSISNLKKRLDELPTDLNKYFERILLSDVAEFYRGQSAELFSVTLEGGEALPLMAYWFMGEEAPKYALKLEVKPLSMQQINKRLKTMKQRLNACCKGLLEVRHLIPRGEQVPLPSSILFDWKVAFLHRTVRDFLVLDETKVLLKRWSSPCFDPHLTTSEALLAQIKTSPEGDEYWGHDQPVSQLARLFDKYIQLPDLPQDSSQISDLQADLKAVLALQAAKSVQEVLGQPDKSSQLPLGDGSISQASTMNEPPTAEARKGNVKKLFGKVQGKWFKK